MKIDRNKKINVATDTTLHIFHNKIAGIVYRNKCEASKAKSEPVVKQLKQWRKHELMLRRLWKIDSRALWVNTGQYSYRGLW